MAKTRNRPSAARCLRRKPASIMEIASRLAYKPHSVQQWSMLHTWAVISLGTASPQRSCGLPETGAFR